ncbi:MAG TPA: PilN domain-containing protein [Burkholderiales bacterium]|jgi:hypothetical protein
MMRALHLDFLQATRPPRWLGSLLLGFGILLGLMVAGEYWRLANERAHLETQYDETSKLLRRETPRLQQPMGDPNLVAKELNYARLILTELSRPWDQMFTELEGAASAHVALLGVQPSQSGDAVRLRGEARNYQDLLAYMVRLEDSPRFDEVLLASHEEQQSGGIRFSLIAKWVRP